MNMRVLGLPSDVGTPGKPLNDPIVRGPIRAVGTYRIKQPLDSMGQLGLADVDYYSAGYPLIFELVRDFDVIVMQRQTMAHHIALAEHISILLKGLAIYDFDDDLLNLDPMNPAYVFWGTDKKALWAAFCTIRDGAPGQVDPRLNGVTAEKVHQQALSIRAGFSEMIQVVDLITVSTDYLKQKYEQVTDTPIEVVPNGVRFEDWVDLKPTRIPGTEDKLLIGWAGGQSHQRDLVMVSRSLIKVLEGHHETVLAFIGWPGAKKLFPAKYHKRIFTMPFMNMDEYRTYVRGFDIGIAPAAKVSQNFGKSPIRVLELGMCGVPVVVSDTTYGDYVPDGCGYVARTIRQFEKGIHKLIRMGPDGRARIGAKLQQHVVKNHEAKVVAARAADVYVEYLGMKRDNGRH